MFLINERLSVIDQRPAHAYVASSMSHNWSLSLANTIFRLIFTSSPAHIWSTLIFYKILIVLGIKRKYLT